jgi:hypothetical protein
MSIGKILLAIVWYSILLFEVITWVLTVIQLGWPGLISFIAFVTVIPLLLAVEGLELAVASLLSSKASLAPAAARELNNIQADRTLPFFPNRQVFVVASIVLLTMASAFQQVYIPGLGWTSNYNLPALFNLAFPTHTVLLLAQVPGKMLALYAPSRFFSQTWWICVAVRWMGTLEVTAPAKPITRLLATLLGYPTRHAPPLPEVLVLYPVYDYIDGQWYYVGQEDEKAVVDAHLLP